MMSRLLALLAEAPVSPPVTGTAAIVYALAVALVGAIGTSAFQFYKYRKQAKREDDSLIAAATGEAVAAAKEMLSEYRLELQRAREEMTELRRKLEQANDRIAKLEGQLESAKEQRSALQEELVEAYERRGADSERYDEMRRRIRELEETVGGVSDRESVRDQRDDARDARDVSRDERDEARDIRDADAISVAEAAREGGHEGAREGVREADRQRTKEKE